MRRARFVTSPKALKSPEKFTRRPWGSAEISALVQFIALHKDDSGKEWPSMRAEHIFWKRAATFIKETAKTSYMRAGRSVRQRVQLHLKQQFKTVDEAEDATGLTVENYLEGGIEAENTNPQPGLPLQMLSQLSKDQLRKLVLLAFQKLGKMEQVTCIKSIFSSVQKKYLQELGCTILTTIVRALNIADKMAFADLLFLDIACEQGIDSNPAGFIALAINSMKMLQEVGKNNLVFKFCEAISKNRPGTKIPLMPLNRMPFGLIQYNIEFFTATHVKQVCTV